MAISTTLPFGREDNLKNLVFTILTKEYPLKIIHLTNYIRKRYGRTVTFQAVRKAVLELKEEGVLTQEDHMFCINASWILEAKTSLDKIYADLKKPVSKPKDEESIGGEVSVFTFQSLNELMRFWQELIDDWYRQLPPKPKGKIINCYQAAHAWEALLHLDKEKEVMGKLKKKGVHSIILCTSNTPLDRNIRNFYKKIKISLHISPSSASFDKGFYVGTYGDLIIQTQYPETIVKQLDLFFKRNDSLENLDLHELSEIVNMRIAMKLTVIKNKAMAEQMNKSILGQI
ncbi:MAG: hypothetical protein ABIJ21_00240 [Nanoarchaeota archaeon]